MSDQNRFKITDSDGSSNSITVPYFPSSIPVYPDDNNIIHVKAVDGPGKIQVSDTDNRKFKIIFLSVRKGDAMSDDVYDLTSYKLFDIFNSRKYIYRAENIKIYSIGTGDDGFPFPDDPLSCRIIDVVAWKTQIPNSLKEVMFNVEVILQKV